MLGATLSAPGEVPACPNHPQREQIFNINLLGRREHA
jgi:hypothetical protein